MVRQMRCPLLMMCYERAVEVIRTANRASVATLQRNMGIRYIDAVRLIDELERRGVIGPKRPGCPTFRGAAC